MREIRLMKVYLNYEWFNPVEESNEMVSQTLIGGGYGLEGKNSDLLRVWGRIDGDGDFVTFLIPIDRIGFLSYAPA